MKMAKNSDLWIMIALSIALIILVAGCVDWELEQLQRVNLNLKWLNQVQFAWNYVA